MSGLVGILCSGQGNQGRNMFALTGAAPEAEPVFAAAAHHLDGIDPRRFVQDADEDALFSNHAGQILCCTQALAAWAALGGTLGAARMVVAGYSVGELAAWHVAGCLEADAVLGLAACRAALMDAAAPPDGGLAAIVGLSEAVLAPVLARHGATIAISNGPDSVVVGGVGGALDRCLDDARQQGATRATRLRVHVPSHTPHLAGAASAFAAVLDGQAPHAPDRRRRLLSGIDADRVRDPKDGLRKLARQIGETVRWSDCLLACGEAGATRLLELGPGTALARMAETTLPDRPARALDQFRGLDGVRTWLAGS